MAQDAIKVSKTKFFFDVSELKKINEKTRYLSISELENLIDQRREKKRGAKVPLDQIVAALKLSRLYGNNLRAAARRTNISHQTLVNWERQIGTVVYLAEPEYQLAEHIENSILKSKERTTLEAYAVVNKGLVKLNTLLQTATTAKQIYQVAEAIKTAAGVLETMHEIEQESKDPESPVVNNFFTDTWNLMIKAANKTQNGNENQPQGNIQKIVQPQQPSGGMQGNNKPSS